jgi:hypothetical protein
MASGRKFNLPSGSHEELGPQLVLQGFDALAQRRLGNVQQRRSSPKVKGLCNRLEIPELDQIHV